MDTHSSPLAHIISQRLAQFPTFLRANGFATGGADSVDSLRVAQTFGVLDRQQLRWYLRALLCQRADEWRRFDRLFDAWFLPANQWQAPAKRESEQGLLSGHQPQGPSSEREHGEDLEEVYPHQAASRQQTTRPGDFRELLQREHAIELETVVRRLAYLLRYIRLRREARARNGRRLDLAATIRRSVSSGGVPLHLQWRDKRRVRPRLVLLIDVSRSMVQYSFFYLRLARALGAVMQDVHSYIFHTHMVAVSQALHDPDPERAQERLHLLSGGWAGGTRIGESLAQFNREYASSIVNSRTSVLILSDGYDTGDVTLLAGQLAQLRRRARRVVWLNPLLNQPGYQPVSQGMTAALPYLDLHAPAGDLGSLKAVLVPLVGALS